MYNNLGVILKFGGNLKMKEYNTRQRKTLIDFLAMNSERAFTIEEIAEKIGEPKHGLQADDKACCGRACSPLR